MFPVVARSSSTLTDGKEEGGRIRAVGWVNNINNRSKMSEFFWKREVFLYDSLAKDKAAAFAFYWRSMDWGAGGKGSGRRR